ncbi:glycosyltransferase family 4 protein [Candidatus Caldatribacterium saccharofermentans]|uniref:glycosyltransferase family 4 protein n=1 Tax=Candidatus Caldatribacterium saccharofermentans TaxID=1454753 RepID=UPI003CFEA43E
MNHRILFLATVDSHIFYFHLPFMKLLRSLGYEVEVAAGEAGFRERIEREGFQVHPIPFSRRPLSFSNFLSFWRLFRLLRERCYVLVHTHTPVASFLGRIAAKIARVPLVLYTAHGFHFFRGASWKAWLFWYTAEKIASFFTDALIVLNEEDFEHGKRLGFIPGENLFLVPGVGVELERFRNVNSSLREELGIGDDEVVVTCVAEFTPTKNHSFLLAAWREVAKRFEHAHLLFVGDGELLEKTRVWAERESLPRVHFLGKREDVPAVLSASDIVVLVSKREGLPRALLEGMAAGKPLVATDVRGNRDLVEDGVNGFLVPLGDVGALVEALGRLIGSKGLRERMGEESRRKVEAYSLERVLQEMERIYRRFLERYA